MIKIARNFLRSALSGYADLLLGKDERPSPDPADWDQHVETLGEDAERRGELAYLKLMLEHALAGPDADLLRYRNEVGYRWSAVELRRIFEHAYRKLWPDDPLPTRGPANIELVGVDGEEWARIKRDQAEAIAARETNASRSTSR